MSTLRKSESERLREERRTKKRNDPISSESEQGEFEIGVNLVQEEVMALQVKKRVKRTCTWQVLLSPHGVYKELTCEFLASMRYHQYDELDRAVLDQGWGWINFLAKGERKMLSSGGGFMSFGPAVQKIRRFWLDSTHQLDRPVSNSIELLFQESKSNPKNVASL
ncbi:unnamed protein product [Microthlaspi erraticum]|uniref:Uncharacterized protein n=1 Tax=Microthlaspi erraticum TaxID=1685480 RepID=A0A6D2LIA9_9BRAS|nr:unnamed protein product [Microthlaspi erraticum]